MKQLAACARRCARPACAPLPPSLLYLSIIKLARFSAAGVGRGLALFERRPFKSLQTNGTGPRSAVTKPTPLSLRPELPACLRPHLSASFGELKRKKTKKQNRSEGLRGVILGKRRPFFPFSVPHIARWFAYEEQSRWVADINTRLRWRETPSEQSAAREARP